MYEMINPYHFKPAYPVHCLPADLQDFIRCVAATTQASDALVGPVVLAAAAAAVQGVADVRAPYGSSSMPTSLFFGVIARSGDRKSSVLKLATTAFEEFEQGLLIPEGSKPVDLDSMPLHPHPFLLEDATEQGVVDVFRQGAKSVFYALDEGALLLRRVDIPALCKRFDGATIRHISRKEGSIVLADKRASVCMLIQDVTFNRIMNKKGELLIESGLMPRMLMSFATNASAMGMQQFGTPQRLQDPQAHSFHDRVRSLMKEYASSLDDPASKRIQLVLDPMAANAWNNFTQQMEWLLTQGEIWDDVRAFVRRAGEQVLRLAAVLQWFACPQPEVQEWAVSAAVQIVEWHLAEAKVAFGEPPLEIQAQQLSETLYDYLLRKAQRTGQTCITRSDLIRCVPTELRNADRLSMATHQLALTGRIAVLHQKNKEYIVLNASQFPNHSQLGYSGIASASFIF